MMPVGAMGVSPPAQLPRTVMGAIITGEISISTARATASGTIRVITGTVPGPTAARNADRKKMTMGIIQAFLPVEEITLRANSSSVPLDCAMLNTSVTPINIRLRLVFQPAIMALSFMPASLPNGTAAAMARTPTFSFL